MNLHWIGLLDGQHRIFPRTVTPARVPHVAVETGPPGKAPTVVAAEAVTVQAALSLHAAVAGFAGPPRIALAGIWRATEAFDAALRADGS